MSSSIYCITCKDENITECYIGSTENLSVRKRGHKSSCNNEKNKLYNIKIYKFIRENGGYDNFKFDIIEEHHTALDKKDLKVREQYYMTKLKPYLNTKNAYQTAEQQKQNKYLKCRCECGATYLKTNKSHHIHRRIHKLNLEKMKLEKLNKEETF